ncbi:MAG: protoheme farnesyltransferase [Candidatus Kaiserbacteria bacterium]|nr:protoheme farnesyltransferase [Candidatus Kaiserbacteria bacterium]
MPSNIMPRDSQVKAYYSVIKPGIIYGNAINVIGGYFLATRGHLDITLLLIVLVGISLIIACGCVINNYIDRDIDARMERTKERVLVRGVISKRNIFLYALALGIVGVFVLFVFTNILTTFVALVGLFFYVVVYSLWGKRKSVYGTLIGAIAGAVPPVVGYLAVTNHIDLGAILLFLVLVVWQMPHSYGIALYRFDDYKNAGIPVLPVVYGVRTTKMHTLAYIVLFGVFSEWLFLSGYEGKIYAVIMGLVSVLWLLLAVRGFNATDDKKWGRSVFLFSLVTVLAFALSLSIGNSI